MVSELHPVERLPEEWESHLSELGERSYRATQIFRWIHQRSIMNPEEMTDLSKTLRGQLADDGLQAPATIERSHISTDTTRKLVVKMPDDARVETVLLPVGKTSNDANVAAVVQDEDEALPSTASARVTQCVSTQVGCAMACVFCASGIAGLKRHLSAAEIVGQVLLGKQFLNPEENLRSIVFMGMGEPLHNYDATSRAIRLLTHPQGLALSPRRITVSTSGLVPEIRRLGEDFGGQVGLALSLHQADNAKRSALMPINQRYPLEELMAALRDYPLPPRRRITIEYTLVAGQNDSTDDARRVAKLLRGLRVKVNLIPMNPIEHSQLGPPASDRTAAFRKVLEAAGQRCFIRRRRGDDVAAACGQLVLQDTEPNARFIKRQPPAKED